MKKLHPLAFAALTLPLILAACGTAATPTATAPSNAKLVKISLHVPAGFVGLKAAGSIKALGLPTDPTNAIPALHFDVHVRDSNGALVAFNNGTYDPSGAGNSTLMLNSQNGFGQTLLLPEGQYTFENAVKDDAGSNTLLAYGPSNENSFAVSGDASVVMLKFHAVYDPTSSALDFSTNTAHLFTDTSFNLNLFAKSSMVNGASYRIPTTDLGAVTYTLGSATDGILNGAGSKLGVNLTAVGTPTDSILDVTASFNAWIQDGAETASFQSTTLNFSKAIETNVMGADTVMPGVSFEAVAPGTVGQAMTLSGTATDNQMVESVKLYDNLNLVASTDADDGVAAVTSDGSGAWSTSWTPTKAGSHDLTVVVADSSGNESHSTQSVVAASSASGNAVVLENVEQYYGYGNTYRLQAGESIWIKIDASAVQASTILTETDVYDGSHWDDSRPSLDDYLQVSGSLTLNGPTVTPITHENGGYINNYFPYAPTYWIKMTNISTETLNVNTFGYAAN